MYVKEHVKMRMDEIVIPRASDEGNENKGPSLSETFCDPVIRRAAYVGCALSIF
jgi:hypothetical protein